MSFLEQLEKEREAGRAEESVNTERGKARADAAEKRTDAAMAGLTNLLKKFLSWKRNLNYLKLLSHK